MAYKFLENVSYHYNYHHNYYYFYNPRVVIKYLQRRDFLLPSCPCYPTQQPTEFFPTNMARNYNIANKYDQYLLIFSKGVESKNAYQTLFRTTKKASIIAHTLKTRTLRLPNFPAALRTMKSRAILLLGEEVEEPGSGWVAFKVLALKRSVDFLVHGS